jgi:hypothetical protein
MPRETAARSLISGNRQPPALNIASFLRPVQFLSNQIIVNENKQESATSENQEE